MQGKKISGYIYSRSYNEVCLKLRSNGYFLLNCKSCSNKFWIYPNFNTLSFLFNSLGLMLSSGMNICEAIDTTGSQIHCKNTRKSLYFISKRVYLGEGLHESMKEEPNIYTKFAIQMIKVGEESGRLDEILKMLGKYYEKLHNMSTKIKAALTYPFVVLIMSIIVLLFFMAKIIPSFMETLHSLGGNIPVITKVLFNTYEFLGRNFFKINMLLGALVFFLYSYIKSPSGKKKYHSFMLNIPVFSKLYKKIIIYKFSITFAILITSGLNTIKSLQICSDSVGNIIVRKNILKAVKSIENGESIYYSLKNGGIHNEMFLNFVRVGEETGKLDNMLFKISDILQVEIENTLKSVISIVEPLMIIILSLFVGIFIAGALLPVLNIMDSM